MAAANSLMVMATTTLAAVTVLTTTMVVMVMLTVLTAAAAAEAAVAAAAAAAAAAANLWNCNHGRDDQRRAVTHRYYVWTCVWACACRVVSINDGQSRSTIVPDDQERLLPPDS